MKLKTIPCFVVAAAISLLFSTQNIAHSALQNPAVSPGQTETLPNWSDPELAKFVYSVVSIKPFKGDDNGGRSLGTRSSPDGYTAVFPLHGLIYEAYRTDHYRVTGGTGWVMSDMWSIEAKMEPEIMEAMQKLAPEKRRIARQHMLQVLLRDYFKAGCGRKLEMFRLTILWSRKKDPSLRLRPTQTLQTKNSNGQQKARRNRWRLKVSRRDRWFPSCQVKQDDLCTTRLG